jgi:putative ABC transport system permease protein
MELMNRQWRVCGIVEPGKLARVFVPLKLLQDLTSNTGKLSQVYVRLTDPARTDEVVASLRAQLPGYQIYSLEEFISQISIDAVPTLKPFINVVIGIGVVVGFLVVFLSMYSAVLERTREIGILKSLGASQAFIAGLLFRETALLAGAGALIGIGLSYFTRWVIMSLVPGYLSQKIVPEWWPIAGGIAVAGALLGAVYPGLKAANQDAIEALAYE